MRPSQGQERSAPAIQRLGEGLRATVIWLFGAVRFNVGHA
jgi:hypothetical protein